ncbi:cyclin family protein [Nonomuraea recticatena]|uniref:Uncharacterized protein n=1 Tax=Nonomuraea recticatena TaxID=46178 RepID=A0ABN3TEI1_9ACTN
MDSEMRDEPVNAPDRCGWCGTVIPPGTGVHGIATDSWVTDDSDAQDDGQRFLTSCGYEHLVALREHYRRRPFLDEELWAGKIASAFERHDVLTVEDLERVTGLSREQIQRCVAWLETQLHRLQ